MAVGNFMYKRSPDRQDVRVCLRPQGEAESQKWVGEKEREKRKGGGGDAHYVCD